MCVCTNRHMQTQVCWLWLVNSLCKCYASTKEQWSIFFLLFPERINIFFQIRTLTGFSDWFVALSGLKWQCNKKEKGQHLSSLWRLSNCLWRNEPLSEATTDVMEVRQLRLTEWPQTSRTNASLRRPQESGSQGTLKPRTAISKAPNVVQKTGLL